MGNAIAVDRLILSEVRKFVGNLTYAALEATPPAATESLNC